jgi:hypothetical protein
VHHKQENKLIVGIFYRLDLIKHSLSLLQQYKSFFETFLRYKVDGAFAKFIDNHRHLVFSQSANKNLPSSKSRSLL